MYSSWSMFLFSKERNIFICSIVILILHKTKPSFEVILQLPQKCWYLKISAAIRLLNSALEGIKQTSTVPFTWKATKDWQDPGSLSHFCSDKRHFLGGTGSGFLTSVYPACAFPLWLFLILPFFKSVSRWPFEDWFTHVVSHQELEGQQYFGIIPCLLTW